MFLLKGELLVVTRLMYNVPYCCCKLSGESPLAASVCVLSVV